MQLSGMSTSAGHAAGRRRAGGGLEALPLGAPGLVDVDVAVDEAGRDHQLADVEHVRPPGGASPEPADAASIMPLAAASQHRGGRRPAVGPATHALAAQPRCGPIHNS